MKIIPNEYQPGEVVFAIINPSVKLVVRRYLDQIYFCREAANPDGRDIAFFERELMRAGNNPKIPQEVPDGPSRL